MADMFDDEPRDGALHDQDHGHALNGDLDHDGTREAGTDLHAHEPVREMPSDYEFADDQTPPASDEAAAAEDHDLLADGELPPAPGARRSLLLPVAAAVGGLVFLSGVAWWQFAPSHHAPVPVARTTAATLPRPIAAQPVAQPINAQPIAAQAVPVQPIAVQPTAPRTDSADAVTAEMPAMAASSLKAPIAAVPVAVAPVAQAPVAQAPAMQAPAMPGAQNPMQAQAAQANLSRTMAADSAAEQQKLSALDGRINALQDAMDKATRQLSEVSNMVAATVGNSNAAADTSKQLQQRLDGIDQQLAQLRSQPMTHRTRAAAPAHADTIAVSDDSAMPSVAPTRAPRHHTRHAKHEAKPTGKSSKMLTASVSGTLDGNDRPSSTPWVLRAASPGQAYVSASPTSGDLKPLHVGDSLPGIGQVTAIRQDGGSWVVQGTKGAVR